MAAHVLLHDRSGRVLLMRRANTGYADGLLGPPAGHLEHHESAADCARREAFEEVGIDLSRTRLDPVATMVRNADHADIVGATTGETYIDLFFRAPGWAGTPTIREPHKCTELVWADYTDLPRDTIPYVASALALIATGGFYDEYGFDTGIRAGF